MFTGRYLQFCGRIIKRCYFMPITTVNLRNFSNQRNRGADDPQDSNIPVGLGSKYKVFRDDDSVEILDVDEEQLKNEEQIQKEKLQEYDEYKGLNLERGETGVFEIEDLIEVLKRDNAEDVFVVELPKEINFVKYICIVTGKSRRHMLAIAQFVRKLYKRKMHDTDLIPKIEGKDSDEWLALDLGNIALHIFSNEARCKYDLDSLWAVGSEYDPESNKQDPLVDLLEKHSIYLSDLKPAS
ncbi:uncharacterized protein LOC108742528 [Agrilus planipennis]|uniref:Mitochondrial assembly of ribosomal large subunit protein 1 n=1 Tax=Agrilus planipennis TaxID=224129 RepID=A0A1W4XLD0_AGRPL|nr:uncharacterized protein LOC108742528 [Agrilus planipennis]